MALEDLPRLGVNLLLLAEILNDHFPDRRSGWCRVSAQLDELTLDKTFDKHLGEAFRHFVPPTHASASLLVREHREVSTPDRARAT